MSITPLTMYAEWFPESFRNHARQLAIDAQYRAEFHAFVLNMPYEQYLESPKWKLTRKLLLIYSPACVRCGGRSNLEIHHLTYERLGLEVLHLADIEVLCRDCHRLIHEKAACPVQMRFPLQVVSQRRYPTFHGGG